jgi:hypothetical protein
MISSVNFSNYYKIASMSQSLNGFIREAMITKAELTSSLASSMTTVSNFPKEIGGMVDIFA